MNGLSLMLVVANLVITNPGTNLREHMESYIMNTKMKGFRWFSDIIEFVP